MKPLSAETMWLIVVLCVWTIASRSTFVSSAANKTVYLVVNTGSTLQRISLNQLDSGLNTDSRDMKSFALTMESVYRDQDPVDGMQFPPTIVTSLASDCATQSLFYALYRRGIYKIGINGDLKKTMAEGDYIVAGMAVDWINRNLYWTDNVTPRIMVSTITPKTTFKEVLKLETSPGGLVILPKKKRLYWANQRDSTIETCELSGKEHAVIVKAAKVDGLATQNQLGGFTSNADGDKLFWTNRFGNNVHSVSLASRAYPQQEEFMEAAPSLMTFGIDEWDGNLYWRNLETVPTKSYRLTTKNLKTGRIAVFPLSSVSAEGSDGVTLFQPVAVALPYCPK